MSLQAADAIRRRFLNVPLSVAAMQGPVARFRWLRDGFLANLRSPRGQTHRGGC